MPLLHKEYSKRAKFTPESLDIFCKNNNVECSLLQENNKKIDRSSRIKGNCFTEKCNGIFNTNFRSLIENKTYYCKECLNKISDKKRQETCNKLYGVSHIAQSTDIQSKIVSTNQIKYGGKSPANSIEIKNKIKETNNRKSQEEKQNIINKRNTTQLKTRGIDYLDYSKEALFELSNELNIILLDDKGESNNDYYDNVKRDDVIHFICINENCNNKYSKTFRSIKERSGAFCEKCTNENMIVKFQTTYEANTGYIHPTQNPEVLEKIKQTNIERRGVEYSLQDPNVKEKGKQTCLEKYGVEYAMQNKEVQEKNKTSCLEKYGVEYATQNKEVQEKTKKTNLETRGVAFSLQDPNVREKGKQTCLKKFGTEHPMQNAEIIDKVFKSGCKMKEYKLPSGNIINYQGWENYALDTILLEEKISEEDLINDKNKVPSIWYKYDGKKHRYYIDIYIPSKKLMIEVKNPYHMKKYEKRIFIKQQAVKDAGYNCEIWVYNSKGEKVECYK